MCRPATLAVNRDNEYANWITSRLNQNAKIRYAQSRQRAGTMRHRTVYSDSYGQTTLELALRATNCTPLNELRS